MKYGFFLAFFLSASCAFAQEAPLNPKPFGLWLQELEQDARTKGISQATLDEAFAGVAPVSRIIGLDRKQPETTQTLDEYIARVVSDKRIEEGRAAFAEHHDLLTKIGGEYGVQPRFIVALWGVETNYGRSMGGFKTVDALATLAYDGRRSDFFRGELLKALEILQQEHMPSAEMKGSWAGAMGQCQFMPSSFLKYAVDYNGDGRRDIWNTPADAFASIANYLHSEGWDPDSDAKDDSVNYKVLLKWNRSRYFATSVQTLAGEIEQQKQARNE